MTEIMFQYEKTIRQDSKMFWLFNALKKVGIKDLVDLRCASVLKRKKTV